MPTPISHQIAIMGLNAKVPVIEGTVGNILGQTFQMTAELGIGGTSPVIQWGWAGVMGHDHYQQLTVALQGVQGVTMDKIATTFDDGTETIFYADAGGNAEPRGFFQAQGLDIIQPPPI